MNPRRLYVLATDVWHFLLGLLTPYTTQILEALLGIQVPTMVVAIIPLIYVAYQSLDDDPADEKAVDLLEYMLGIIAAMVHRV
jgi:hypothetical protein